MNALPKYSYTLQEYFEIERDSEEKFEYWDGNIWSMAGDSPVHERIVVNVGAHLRELFRGRGCSVFGSNLKVKVPVYPPYRYPDLSVYCGEGIYETMDGLDVLTNPHCAICLFSGDLFCLLLPNMKKECFQIFIDEFARHTANSGDTLLIADGAGSHQADTIRDSSGLALEKLPTACPELNPAERFFQELRRGLANQVFETIGAVEEKIKQLLENYWKEPNLIIRLTSFPYINNINTSFSI